MEEAPKEHLVALVEPEGGGDQSMEVIHLQVDDGDENLDGFEIIVVESENPDQVQVDTNMNARTTTFSNSYFRL